MALGSSIGRVARMTPYRTPVRYSRRQLRAIFAALNSSGRMVDKAYARRVHTLMPIIFARGAIHRAIDVKGPLQAQMKWLRGETNFLIEHASKEGVNKLARMYMKKVMGVRKAIQERYLTGQIDKKVHEIGRYLSRKFVGTQHLGDYIPTAHNIDLIKGLAPKVNPLAPAWQKKLLKRTAYPDTFAVITPTNPLYGSADISSRLRSSYQRHLDAEGALSTFIRSKGIRGLPGRSYVSPVIRIPAASTSEFDKLQRLAGRQYIGTEGGPNPYGLRHADYTWAAAKRASYQKAKEAAVRKQIPLPESELTKLEHARTTRYAKARTKREKLRALRISRPSLSINTQSPGKAASRTGRAFRRSDFMNPNIIQDLGYNSESSAQLRKWLEDNPWYK